MNAAAVALLLVLASGCPSPGSSETGDGPGAGRAGDGGQREDGVGQVFAAFTITGCATLEQEDGAPHCLGTAPLTVQLVAISAGAEQLRWQVTPGADGGSDGGADGGGSDGGADGGGSDGGADGGGSDGGADGGGFLLDEASSHERAPILKLPRPGRYQVSLAVGGRGGTASAVGLIEVSATPLGAPCREDAQCATSLRCLCGAGVSCSGGLAAGMCTRGCESLPCPVSSVCLDLSRGASPRDGGTGEPWRELLCVPGCRADRDCRSDLQCRELPVHLPGDGRLRFASACFAATPAGVGEACVDPGGAPDASACATGLCEPLGARNLCSAACATSADCPSGAACAKWNGTGGAGAPVGPRCLARCDGMNPCTDTLLSCQPEGGAGALGFRLPGEPAETAVCAPRRCSAPGDCKLGRCQALGGASFCVR